MATTSASSLKINTDPDAKMAGADAVQPSKLNYFVEQVYKDRCKLAQERADWNKRTNMLQVEASRLHQCIGKISKSDAEFKPLMKQLGEIEGKFKAKGWYQFTKEYGEEDDRLRMMEKAIKREYDTWLCKHLEEKAVRYARMRKEVEIMVPKDAEIIRRYIQLQKNIDEFKETVVRIIGSV
ncbi:hypothetical protein FBEOM_13862 [Fusarium beomiforme]|uniref:Uncharacterized protein n=1 Tax=Fusarium beomiforme TaxID=44412 RepID=A0A9P5DRP9_9HYPO|nr:hypothetical protein FBEOM_13862 [Fusarium beomiforme]